MNLLSFLANSKVIWKWYFCITGIIAFIIAIADFPRFYGDEKRKKSQKKTEENDKQECFVPFCNSIRSSLFDGLIMYFGFILLSIEIQLFYYFTLTSTAVGKTVSGILIIIILFYSVFCISGRGIEVLKKIFMDPGVSEIIIGWKGIQIKTGGQINE